MSRRLLSIGIAFVLAATPVTVVAASALVQTMKGWNRAAKSVDAMLAGQGTFDAGTARAALQLYADEAGQIAAQLHGKSADAQDYRARFAALAADAKAALPASGQPATLKAAFSHLTAECSSCHATYRD